MAGVYVIDPDGRTGMLDDGTEISIVPWSPFNGHDCGACILDANHDGGCFLSNCDKLPHPDEIKRLGVIFKAKE